MNTPDTSTDSQGAQGGDYVANVLTNPALLPDVHTKAGFEEIDPMNMKRFVFLATLAAGVTAAYLMQKRGESLLNIVKKTISNPLGALAEELRLAILPQSQRSLPSAT